MGTPFPGSEHDDSERDDHPLFGALPQSAEEAPAPDGFVPRSQRRAATARRRGRFAPLVALVVLLVLGVGGTFAFMKVRDRFDVPDYKGNGSGRVDVRVNVGDGAGDVAETLFKAGVVKSVRAFTRAARDSGRAGDIQPGLYRMPKMASGKAALAAILDPANRLVTKVTIPEGRTEKQILEQLAKATNLPLGELQKAAADLANLGLPTGLKPKTAEGFLYPATYEFDPSQSATEVVQTLTTAFNTQWVKLGVAAAAAPLRLTPYQVLTMASMIESEAKFPEDRPKIARVILNRLALDMPLGIDAVSRYGAMLKGLDPDKVEYSTIDSPYNTYLHRGLPPGPISNPGESSLNAAIHPAKGDWVYYVVMDAKGHHLFTSNEQEFLAAAQRCRDNDWGC